VPEPDLDLLVMSRRGAHTVALPRDAEVTIGRGDACEVRIEDDKISRRHATLRTAGGIELLDLGSRNGTIVNGRRLAPHETVVLTVGDVVALGSSVVRLQCRVKSAVKVWTTVEYAARLEAVRAEAAATSGAFALLLLRVQPLARPGASDATTLESTRGDLMGRDVDSAFAQVLRAQDVVAPADVSSYRVILRDVDEASARKLGRQLSASLAAMGVRAQVGVATFPREGTTRSELEVAAEGALSDVGYLPVTGGRAMGHVMRGLDQLVTRVAPSEINVVVSGETGVGKEVVATAIHARSPRASGPFVGLNCAALSESLFESELFGYERGAFTGATRAKPGLLEAAEGGTLFFDEVAEMSLSAQAKLLRVLEQRQVLRLGSIRPKSIDVRVVSATNKDLEREVSERRFRQDLYFRLNGICIRIPPLRDRLDEIEPLAKQFLDAVCLTSKQPVTPTLAPGALDALRGYDWPGNIRELRNVIERALLLSSGGVIRAEHLGLHGASGGTLNVAPGPAGLDGRQEDERRRIVEALERCVWNQTYAAELLGISRRTLVTRLQRYGIARPRTRPSDLG
jgi:transcriptional regulator with AAA-type ATPase domain